MRHSRITVSLVALISAWSCNRDGEDDAGEGTAETSAGEVTLDTNPVAASYPEGLAVSAFSQADDTTAGTSAQAAGTVAISYAGTSLHLRADSLALATPPSPAPAPQSSAPGGQCFTSYQAALAANKARTPEPPPPRRPPIRLETEAKDRINGKATDCLSTELEENLEIMKGLIRTSGQGLDGYGDCFLPDWGIVLGRYPGSQDVCTVGYARAALRKLGAYVDFAKGLSEAMLCQALKDRVVTQTLPGGESLDLTESLRKALGKPQGTPLAVKSAKLTRASQGTGYLTELVVAPSAELGGQTRDLDVAIVIDHKPDDGNNQSYKGVVRLSHQSRGAEITAATFALSVDYSRLQDAVGSRIKYELRSGLFAEGKSPFGADGVVDFNVFGLETAANGQPIRADKVANMNLVSYDGYPALDVAKLSYWVSFGGTYKEPARGMVFDVKREGGKVKGCAVAGATSIDAADGQSIRRGIQEGYAMLPVGYLRPFLCSDRTGAKMWLQCFYRDDAGQFVPDPALITDTATGYDFVASSIVEAKAPTLADVPRPPRFTAAKFQPPAGAPIGPNMPKAPAPPPPP